MPFGLVATSLSRMAEVDLSNEGSDFAAHLFVEPEAESLIRSLAVNRYRQVSQPRSNSLWMESSVGI
jgi:hypothetical protein